MKKFTLSSILILVIGAKCVAQSGDTTLFNVPYNPSGSVVSPLKLNILYIGVDNLIDIAVPKVSGEDITASTTDGTITKVSDGQFIATVDRIGKLLITVYVKGKKVSSHEFRTRRIPDPQIRFNGLWINSKVSVATFKKITELIPVTENFEYEAPFNILSFRFVLQSNGNDQTVNVTGPLFNTEIRTLLDHAKPGDVINIDNIIVVGPDLVKRKLDGLTIKVI